MTLSERIARAQAPNVCYFCKQPYTGRYDAHSRKAHDLPQSPFVQRALRGELPAKVTR